MHKVTTGSFLKQCRMDRRMSLKEIAKETGLNQPLLSRIENNKFRLNFSHAVKLCDYYGVRLDLLADIVRDDHQ